MKDCNDLGFAVERSEIVKALWELIEDGMARACLLSGKEPYCIELDGMPPLDVVEEYSKTYFYMTEKGMDFNLADHPSWPFDDEGEPRPDWRLDEPPTLG